MNLTASIVILVVILMRFVLKKAPRYITCLLWIIVAIRLILPFTVESRISLIPDIYFINTEKVSTVLIDYTEDVSEISEVSATLPYEINNDFEEKRANNSIEIYTKDETTSRALSLVWIVGVTVTIGYGTISTLLLKKKLAAALVDANGIYVSDNINTPFVFGIIKPRIYIPSSLENDVATYVVEHEKAHLKRGDNIWKLIAYILLSIHWFNPLVWISFELFERDIELACDECVIAKMDIAGRKAYANALLKCTTHKRIVLSYPLYFGETGIMKRIKAIKNYKKSAIGVVILSMFICVAIAGCFLTDSQTEETTPAETSYTQASEYTYFDDIEFQTDNCVIVPKGYSFDGYVCNLDYEVSNYPEGGIVLLAHNYEGTSSGSSHISSILNGNDGFDEVRYTLIFDTYNQEFDVEFAINGYPSTDSFYLHITNGA